MHSRREFLKGIGLALAGMSLPACLRSLTGKGFNPFSNSGRQSCPNIIVIFTDDQGYADLSCFGAKDFKTPRIDRLAGEGMKFTDFYVTSPACSPSRAALLTGCYHPRVGIEKVLFPRSPYGLNPEEITIADLVKSRGYATMCIGKWHLGDSPQWMPRAQGFDEYYGLPYSNDMFPHHKGEKHGTEGKALVIGSDVPVTHNGALTEPVSQDQLTTLYTEQAVSFIERNTDRPFFLYLAHSMPHVPVHASEKFRGKTARLYGDVIQEIDWSAGQICDALAAHGLEENTLVIFTSDNGPWLPFGKYQAGEAFPLRGGKGSVWEGGVREPCVMRWPGRIPAGSVCAEPVCTIDILPTVAEITGAQLPQDRIIDGRSILPLMNGDPGAQSPHEALFFSTIYGRVSCTAVRSGKWKMHLRGPGLAYTLKPGEKPAEAGSLKYSLYDLHTDIGEQNNVAEKHPEVTASLAQLVLAHLADIRKNKRPVGGIPPKA